MWLSDSARYFALLVYRAVTYKNYLPLNKLIHVPSDGNIHSQAKNDWEVISKDCIEKNILFGMTE